MYHAGRNYECNFDRKNSKEDALRSQGVEERITLT